MQLTKHIKQGTLLHFSQIYPDQTHDAISISENEHYRWIAFGDVIQSVMHKRLPWKLTLPHQTAILLPLLFFRPINIIELGLGGGNNGRYICHLNSHIDFTSIECNQEVILNFNEYFNPEKSPINIIYDRAEHWLKAKATSDTSNTSHVDWLICDVYQQQLHDFKDTIELLDGFMATLNPNACLSINLPDSSDQEVNLCLTVLQQLQTNHRIIYFHIPNYLNIVIHVVPDHWRVENVLKKNKYSYLPKRTYAHWRKFWQYFKEI